MCYIIINPVPGINSDYTLDDDHDMARIKILANINIQYLDLVLNKPDRYRSKYPIKGVNSNSIFSNNKFKVVKNVDKVLSKFNKMTNKKTQNKDKKK